MKKGFTLIELLAVIVILAIVLVIAVPTVLKTIQSAKKGAIESDAKLIIDAIEKKKASDDSFIYTDITKDNIEEKLGIKNTNYRNIEVTEVNGRPSIVIEGQSKYDGYTAYGTYTSVEAVPSDEYEEEEPTYTDYADSEGVNRPKLATGMTAIKWNGSTWVDVANPDTDTSWYDYTNKEWANAKTADGSFWVWMPRYAYQIATNFHTSSVGTINVKFLKDGTNVTSDGSTVENIPVYSGSSQTNYVKHPAFTFGSTELTGIWVAKFEPSGTENAINILPGVASLRPTYIDDEFTACRNMETNARYGWGTSGTGIDTHMMKNTEWGLVVYLAQSTFGKNAEVWSNPSSDFITGCAGSSANASDSSGCSYSYTTANGQKASTTGNTYGVYDMSGGSPEYVAAYLNSSFVSPLIPNSDAKYRDVYVEAAINNCLDHYTTNSTKFGDALWETSFQSGTYSYNASWYGEDSYMPTHYSPWIVRGDGYFTGAKVGIFAFNNFDGWVKGDAPPFEPNPPLMSFRPVILVNGGL